MSDPVPDQFTTQFNLYFESLLADPKTDPSTKTLITFMNDYVKVLSPMTLLSGIPAANKQIEFYKVLKQVVETPTPDLFNKNWIIILAYFWVYRGKNTLGEAYINRFAENWHKGDDNLKTYQRLVNLCMISADPRQRSNVKAKINFVSTLSLNINSVGQQNILRFYNV